MKIMLVDDNRTYLALQRKVIENVGENEISCFESPVDALAAARDVEFDLVIVDYLMPGMDGIDFVGELRSLDSHKIQPIVMVTTSDDVDTRHRALEAGVTDFLHKPVEPIELKVKVRNLLALREGQTALRDRAEWLAREVAKATEELRSNERDMVLRISRAIDCRDGHTGDHIERMATICGLVAEGMGLPPETCRQIETAAPLHDVGKIGIPDAILLKPGKLTDQEMDCMRSHVVLGEKVLADSASSLLQCAARIASSHHERWDGHGYPRRIAGDRIPIEGRIAAVADVFEALCADRIYRKGLPPDEARAFIVAGRGAHFDPDCVDAFLSRWDAIRDVVSRPQNLPPPSLDIAF